MQGFHIFEVVGFLKNLKHLRVNIYTFILLWKELWFLWFQTANKLTFRQTDIVHRAFCSEESLRKPVGIFFCFRGNLIHPNSLHSGVRSSAAGAYTLCPSLGLDGKQ
jgi:hypothetical protein